MKCMFDTNVYISFIRDRSHSTELQRRGTVKYLSAIVLSELWAGTKTKKAKKLINQLQQPYVRAGRVVTLGVSNFTTLLVEKGLWLMRSLNEMKECRFCE